MPIHRYIVGLILAMPLVVASSLAYALTGDGLLKQCTSPESSVERRECGSYILGTMSGANMMMVGMRELHPDYPMFFCVTPVEPTENLIEVVVTYLKQHPNSQHYDAASQVLLAFSEAFPCH